LSNSRFSYIENAYPNSASSENRGQKYNSYSKPFKSELLANKTNFPDYIAFNQSDNLHYYNKPYVPELQPIQLSQQYPEQYTQPQPFTVSANTPKFVTESSQSLKAPMEIRENFTSQSSNDGYDHMENLKHVLNCNDCKFIIQKNLGINSAQESNKEIIELMSYIGFGIILIIILQN